MPAVNQEGSLKGFAEMLEEGIRIGRSPMGSVKYRVRAKVKVSPKDQVAFLKIRQSPQDSGNKKVRWLRLGA